MDIVIIVSFALLFAVIAFWPRKVRPLDIFFADFENTGPNGLEGVENIPENSVVLVFYRDKNQKFKFFRGAKFRKAAAKFRFCRITTCTKESVDFSLSTFLGYLIAKYGNAFRYCIVSNDSGYASVIDFWRRNGVNVRRTKSLEAIPPAKSEKVRIRNFHKIREIVNDPVIFEDVENFSLERR